jgi:SCP-2 sterol transfer family protein
VAEFLSDAWLAALDDAARAAGPLPALAAVADGDGDTPFVLEQVVRDGDNAEIRYQVEFAATGLRVRADDQGEPDVTFATDRATAAALSRGETNAQRALAAGHFQVSGDIEGLVARSDALVALDDVFAAVRAETTYR